MTKWTPQNWLKTLRLSLKSRFWSPKTVFRFNFFTDKRNVVSHFWDVHFVFFAVSLYQSMPLGLTFCTLPFPLPSKVTKRTSQKWPTTLRLSVKKWISVVNWTTRIHFFTDKRNVFGHFDMFILSFWQSPCVSQCLWGWLSALYHFRCPVCIFDCKVACNKNTLKTQGKATILIAR